MEVFCDAQTCQILWCWTSKFGPRPCWKAQDPLSRLEVAPNCRTPALSLRTPVSDTIKHIGYSHRRRKEVWDWGKTTGGLGNGSPPAGSGAEPPEAEEFLKYHKQILCIFGSISHIFTYIWLFFPCCRHHSTKSAKWGAFDTVCPLVCKWGQLPPLPPAPPPMWQHQPMNL